MTDDRPDTGGPHLPPPIDQAAEVLLFAPLGFLVGLRDEFPAYVARGRHEVGEVQGWLGRRVQDAVHESAAALRGLGLLPAGDPEPVEAPEADPTAPPALSVVPTPADEPGPRAEGPDPESLAIPGYESLSASQVVPRLVSLTADELEAVRRYEEAARGRKTILSRIAQLQAG